MKRLAIPSLLLLSGIVWLAATAPEPAPLESELRLELNLPARRLDVLVFGKVYRSHSVAVGQAIFPTPLGSFEVSRVVWNPWWYPPPSEWAADAEITPPGPSNPMGRVKLYFKELYFLHGTPSVESLGCAASHGCVRMANDDAMALARLVHEYGIPDVDAAELDRLLADPSATRDLRLTRPVPLEIVYRLVEVRDGEVQVHPDIYGSASEDLPEAIESALERAGYGPDEIDREAVEALAQHGTQPGGETVSAPIEAMLSPPRPQPQPVESLSTRDNQNKGDSP